MHFAGDSCTVDIGSNVFTTTFASLSDDRLVVLAIDDIRVVSFTHVDGQLLLDMVLHDEEDKRIFEVVESQLTYASNELWDIEFVGKTPPSERGAANSCLRSRLNHLTSSHLGGPT